MIFTNRSKCERCNGKGFFTLGGNEFTCRVCAGVGWVDIDTSPESLIKHLRDDNKYLLRDRDLVVNSSLSLIEKFIDQIEALKLELSIAKTENIKVEVELADANKRADKAETVLGVIYSLANNSTYDGDLHHSDLHDALVEIQQEAHRALKGKVNE